MALCVDNRLSFLLKRRNGEQHCARSIMDYEDQVNQGLVNWPMVSWSRCPAFLSQNTDNREAFDSNYVSIFCCCCLSSPTWMIGLMMTTLSSSTMKPRVILLVSSSGDSGSPAFKTTISFTRCQHEDRLWNFVKTWYCYLAEAFPKGGENKVELGTIVAHSELEQTLNNQLFTREGSRISLP